MSEDKFLRYTVNEGEYVFFYGDEILFFNSKSNPFIYITVEKEGVKKELPLTYCDITRMTAYGYKIKFYNKNCAINVKVNAARNMVFFEFTKLGFFGETISINLYRKNFKIKGMGLNQYKDINNMTCDRNGFIGKKEYCDVKPAFSIKNGYFFKDIDIEDFQLQFYGRQIKLNTRQNNGQFTLEFDKKYYFGDKEKNIIKSCSIKEALSYCKEKESYDGFLLKYDFINKPSDAIKVIRKSGYKCYIYFRPTITEKDVDFKKYEKEGLIFYKGEYFIDSKNKTNVLLLQNKIRALFDENIDGLYLDERTKILSETKEDIFPYIGGKLHKDIYKITKEYPEKRIIYNKLYLDEKQNEIYSLSYSSIKKKEEDYKKSLTYSVVDKVFYECTEKEYETLPEEKQQIILL